MTANRNAGGGAGKKRQISLPDLPEIIEWLAGDECHELDDAELAGGGSDAGSTHPACLSITSGYT